MRRTLAPLRHREFRLLFLGRLTSLSGSAIAPIALAFAVLHLTHSATDLGLVLAAGAVPQIVLFLFGGVIADRFRRNRVMVVTDVISAAAQFAACALVLNGSVEIWHLAVLNAIRGGSSAFFFPAAQGLTPQTVPDGQLQEANALLRLTFSGTNIVGASLGGILVATVGPGWALGFDGVTYLLGALFIAAMRVPSTRVAAVGSTVLRELREGWDEFSSRTWLWTIVLSATIANCTMQIGVTVLGPYVAETELGGAASWGFIAGAAGVGFLIGGLIALRIRPKRPLLLAQIVVLLGGCWMLGLALGLPVWAIAVGAGLAGVGFEIFGVFWDLSLQQHIPRDRLSRVYSYDALGSFVAIPIGQALAGPLAAAIGVTEAIWLAFAMFMFGQAMSLLVPSVRTLRRTDISSDDAQPALETTSL